eukprot:6180499-Pleurochrysis_carterae.AAC.3
MRRSMKRPPRSWQQTIERGRCVLAHQQTRRRGRHREAGSRDRRTCVCASVWLPMRSEEGGERIVEPLPQHDPVNVDDLCVPATRGRCEATAGPTHARFR